MEEARVVQAFLDQVESEVAGEKTQEEEMTSDQLSEKLERLEVGFVKLCASVCVFVNAR